MEIMERIYNVGVVPVVVIDNAEDAVPTARALLAGDVDVMEITFRTPAAADAIRAVAEECPEMLVGAGTVMDADQCRRALELGAKFIVCAGLDEEVVSFCVERGVPVLPGTVTPTEIMAARKHGLRVVKFFPANVYGGLSAMKALAGPFVGLKFMPTGVVNAQNLAEYMAAPFIFAVGGSWLCTRADIAAGNFEKITALCREARNTVLGFELAHVGVNTDSEEDSLAVCRGFHEAFGFETRKGNSSNFAGSGVEVMKKQGPGEKGHIAVRTNSVARAAAALARRGFAVDESTAREKNGVVTGVYLKDRMGGFAVHLLQK